MWLNWSVTMTVSASHRAEMVPRFARYPELKAIADSLPVHSASLASN